MYIDSKKTKEGKLPLAEVHPQFIESLSLVSEISKEKGYEPLNWCKPEFKGGFCSYLCSAALRHINTFIRGEDWNIEIKVDGTETKTKVLHLEAAAYNLLMAATLYRMGRKDLDDRSHYIRS